LSPLPKAESLDQLHKDRVPVAKALNSELKLIIPRLLKSGSYTLQDGDTVDTCALRTALSIEHGIHSKYTNNLGAYGSQFRAIRFNIKKNENLVIRILNGVILPEELAEMSSMDMASEELQKERAAIKEEADKQAVLAHEEGPRYRKTHKGDELIGDEPQPKTVEAYTAPVRRRTVDTDASPVMPLDTGSPTLDEPTSPSDRRGSSERPSFNIQQVWKSVAPDAAKAGLIQRTPKRRSSSGGHKLQDIAMRDAADDPDLDRLLNDDVDMPSSPAELDPTVVWTGQMHMPNVGSFRAVARFGAGGDVGQRVPYADLLFPSLEIDGRIPIARADEYVAGMRYSATTDVCVLAVRPADTERDRRGFDDVFGYFRDKQRWGVVARHRHADVRDMYVVTVEAGASPLPDFLTMLDQSEIEPLRPHNLLLLTMVVRTRPGAAAAGGAPPAVSPAITQGVTPPSSHFSPVSGGPHGGFGQPFAAVPPVPSPSAPSASPYPTVPAAAPAPAMSNLAVQILGPYVTSPVVTQILASVSDMTHVQLQNLRDILEREPATRSDIIRLSEHLAQRQHASGGQ
jgi:SPOC domain/Transcription factor S-II (TFIIS), central domain